MQKLEAKLKNTPKDTSLVLCSVNLLLNKDQSLSATDIVLTSNNPEVNQSVVKQQKQELRLPVKVYVLNMRGNPLMPCSARKAKKLLKEEKAKVVKRMPFTIQLLISTGETKQDITLGIDTGFGNIGFSAVSEKEELISGTLVLDNKTKERLDEKRMYRKLRRNKLWYREPRWSNRANNKIEGWLPPSIKRKFETHINLINRIKKLLPIIKTIIEVAKFDIQKIENPEISGKDYQQGTMFEYQNIRAYLMTREKGKCEHCKKDFINNPSHIHHRKMKNKNGSNRLENLMLVHEKCHKLIHKDLKLLKKYEKSSTKEYKQSAFMSIINKRFYGLVENLEITFGNITFVNRNKIGLEKSHINDAFIIAGGNIQERIEEFNIIQKHRNNRVLQLNRKGFKPSIKKEKSKINPGDLFWIGNKIFSCKGMFNYGRYILFGNMKLKEYARFVDVIKIFKFGSLIWNI